MGGVYMPTMYDRIRRLRKGADLTQDALADKIGVASDTISRWENGKRQPRSGDIAKLASVLNTSVSYILGETEDATPAPANVPANPTAGIIRVPLFSMGTAASCGAGNGLYGVSPESTEFIFVDEGVLSSYDDLRKPFAIHTEGDSMTGAGIVDGSVVVVNPADEVLNGSAALVSYNDRWYIKWVVFNPDKSIELRSANSNYAPIRIDAEYANDPTWFRIIGKVVRVITDTRPRNAF